MRGILTVCLLAGGFILNAQNIFFYRNYGDTGADFGRDVKQDLDTGYIATGSSSSFGSGTADAFLLKVDSLGNFKWSYPYGGSESDWGESVIINADSGYAIGGYTNSFGAGGFDFYFIKADDDGTPIFEKTYGGPDWDRAHDIGQTSDGGYVLVGETHSFGNGNSDIYIVRTNNLGDTLWTRSYGGADADYANACLIDGDSIVVVGGTESFGSGMSDGIVMKYHMDGTLGWVKYYGMERNDFFTGITARFGEYWLSGQRHYYFDQTGHDPGFWIYNMSDDGMTDFADTTITVAMPNEDIAYDIEVDQFQNMYYVGCTKSLGYATVDGNWDGFLGKSGTSYWQAPWANNFGVQGDEILYAMDFCYDEGIIAIGNMDYQSEGGASLILVKVDKNNTGGPFQVLTELVENPITLSIEETEYNAIEAEVYPVPFYDIINLEGFSQSNSCVIYNSSGQVVFQKENVQDQINLGFLNHGLYVIHIQTEEGLFVKKIVKN